MVKCRDCYYCRNIRKNDINSIEEHALINDCVSPSKGWMYTDSDWGCGNFKKLVLYSVSKEIDVKKYIEGGMVM
jgi:hypothetical protein